LQYEVQPDMLSAKDLSKRFGALHALDLVSLDVSRNTIAGVIGPNGAGKTTLLLGMAGLLPMDAGTLSWEGKPIPAIERSRVFFYVEDAVRPHAQLQVGFVLHVYACIFRHARNVTERIVERLRLQDFMRTRVSDLSKGTAKRFLIAVGLLSTQPVLMLDEPFDGLDLKQMLEVVPLLREIAVAGRTLVLSIHQLRDAERACDQFVLLSSGRVAGQGTLGELQARARCEQGSGLEEVFLRLV
jgi:ABC-2 type transport system ATP-binding protein